jgi:hypothetical protein
MRDVDHGVARNEARTMQAPVSESEVLAVLHEATAYTQGLPADPALQTMYVYPCDVSCDAAYAACVDAAITNWPPLADHRVALLAFAHNVRDYAQLEFILGGDSVLLLRRAGPPAIGLLVAVDLDVLTRAVGGVRARAALAWSSPRGRSHALAAVVALGLVAACVYCARTNAVRKCK